MIGQTILHYRKLGGGMDILHEGCSLPTCGRTHWFTT